MALILARSTCQESAALLRRASPALLVIGIWLACHPYAGIVHDSRLYLTQIFRLLNPDVFGGDLFFAFGSQDDFTLFSHLGAPLVSRLGPAAATMVMVAAGHVLWLSGAAALALRLAPTAVAAVVGLTLLAGMPAYYGGWQSFSFGEGFATPRLHAEGFALWALWALSGGRPVAAATLMLVSALLHPLVAVAALCVGFCFLVLRDRRWLLLGLAAPAAVAILAYAGVAPFAALTETMDPDWLAIVEKRNVIVFPALWKPSDWARIVLAAAATLSGAAILTDSRRQLFVAGTLAGLGGVLVGLLGADMLHNSLLIQVQLWRTLWLLHVFAYLGAGFLFAKLWEMKDDGLALIAAIILSWLIEYMLFPGFGSFIGVLAFTLAVLRLKGLSPPLSPVFLVGSITLAGLAIGFLVIYRIIFVADRLATEPGVETVLQAFGVTTVIEAAAAGAVALVLLRFRPGTARAIFPAAALVLVIASGAVWDRRDAWSRALTEERPIGAFDALLPSDAQVYWEDDVRGAWLLLGRPSYVSHAQGSGVLFERRTAMAFRDRARLIAPVTGKDLLDYSFARHQAPPPLPALSRNMLVDTCRRDRALDAMVLSREVAGAFAAEWELPTPFYEKMAARKRVARPPVRRLYLYRCSDLI